MATCTATGFYPFYLGRLITGCRRFGVLPGALLVNSRVGGSNPSHSMGAPLACVIHRHFVSIAATIQRTPNWATTMWWLILIKGNP